MSGNRLRVIIIAALAATLVALVLTLALQPPTGPSRPGTTLHDCAVFYMFSEFVILAAYYACILSCWRSGVDAEAKALCELFCLRWFIIVQFVVIVLYIACILNVVLS